MSDNVHFERRKYVRVSSSAILKVEEFNGDIEQTTVTTKNISQGGLLFEFSKSYPLSTVLGLELRLPEVGRRIDCYGKVVRVEQLEDAQHFDIGICFINMSDEDFQQIGKFVELQVNTGDV